MKYVKMITLCLVSLAPSWSFADDPKAPDQRSPREQLQALIRQANQDYQAATAELAKSLKEAKSVHNMMIGLEIDLSIGAKAPEIEGEDLDGKRLRLSDYRGKVVVLCFWATYCGTSRTSH